MLLTGGALYFATGPKFNLSLRGAVNETDPIHFTPEHPFPVNAQSGSGGTSVIEIPPKCEDFAPASRFIASGAQVRFNWKVSATDKVRVTGEGFDSGLIDGHNQSTTEAGHGLGYLDITPSGTGKKTYKLTPYWYQGNTTPGYTCLASVTVGSSGDQTEPSCTTLTSSASVVRPTSPITLTWASAGADSVTLRKNTGGDNDSTVVQANLPASGSLQVTPDAASTLYRIVPFKASGATFGRDTCNYEQIGEQAGPILDVRDNGSPRASFWSINPLNPGEGFNCLKAEFDLQTPNNIDQIMQAYEGISCPIYFGIAAMNSKPNLRKLLSGGLFHYLQEGCSRGRDRLEMNNSWADNSGTGGPWAPGNTWKVLLEATSKKSSIALFQNGSQAGPTISANTSSGSGQMTVAETRDASFSIGQKGIGEVYFPWYGAKYSNLKIWADVIPATDTPLTGPNCTVTVRTDPNLVDQAGTCGTANTVGTPTSPTANLCATGTASTVRLDGTTWRWSCGSGTLATQCSAPKTDGGGAGVCGSANGVATVTAPTTNLCSSGNSSSVTLDGNTWKWTCNTTQCTAPKPIVPPLVVNPATQTILVGQTPTPIAVTGGTAPYTLTISGTNATGLTPTLDTATNTIRFSAPATAAGTLGLSLHDAATPNATITAQVVVNAPTIRTFSISSSCDGQRKFIGDVCTLRATATLDNGSTSDISSQVTWQGFEEIGTVTGSVLTITKHRAVPETVAAISARLEQPALTSTNTITITVVEAIPRILSIFTAGNRPVAKGSSDDLFIRLISPEGAATLRDIEVSLLDESFATPAEIPVTARRYSVIETGIVPTVNDEGARTYLLKVNVVIPILSELHEGPATLLVDIFTPAGNKVSAVSPIFIGNPPSGDVDGNGEFTLLDIVLLMKMANRELLPTPEQISRGDFDNDGVITIIDVLQAFRLLFSRP